MKNKNSVRCFVLLKYERENGPIDPDHWLWRSFSCVIIILIDINIVYVFKLWVNMNIFRLDNDIMCIWRMMWRITTKCRETNKKDGRTQNVTEPGASLGLFPRFWCLTVVRVRDTVPPGWWSGSWTRTTTSRSSCSKSTGLESRKGSGGEKETPCSECRRSTRTKDPMLGCPTASWRETTRAGSPSTPEPEWCSHERPWLQETMTFWL